MEMTLKMGAFEALDENEMLAVDGGISWNDVGLALCGTAGAIIGGAIAPGIGSIVGTAVGVIIYTWWD